MTCSNAMNPYIPHNDRLSCAVNDRRKRVNPDLLSVPVDRMETSMIVFSPKPTQRAGNSWSVGVTSSDAQRTRRAKH